MASSFSLSMAIDAKYQAPADLGATAQLAVPYNRRVDLADGTVVGKADRMYSKTRTLIASATEDLDLAGVLTDIFGSVLTFVKVKGIAVVAAPGNTNNVIVGAAGGAPWLGIFNATGTVTLKPGGWFAAACGVADNVAWPVVATTADLLKVANSAGGSSVNYDIVIIGTSA